MTSRVDGDDPAGSSMQADDATAPSAQLSTSQRFDELMRSSVLDKGPIAISDAHA
jgi:hypothetical protein